MIGRCKWSIRFDEYFPFSLFNYQCMYVYFSPIACHRSLFLIRLLKFLNVIIKCHLLVTVFLSFLITILSVCPCLFVSLPFHFISLFFFPLSLSLSLSFSLSARWHLASACFILVHQNRREVLADVLQLTLTYMFTLLSITLSVSALFANLDVNCIFL